MCYFQREKKNLKLTSGSVWQLGHLFWKNILKPFVLKNSNLNKVSMS